MEVEKERKGGEERQGLGLTLRTISDKHLLSTLSEYPTKGC